MSGLVAFGHWLHCLGLGEVVWERGGGGGGAGEAATGKAPDQEVGHVLSQLYKWSAEEWLFDPVSEGPEHREGSRLQLLSGAEGGTSGFLPGSCAKC